MYTSLHLIKISPSRRCGSSKPNYHCVKTTIYYSQMRIVQRFLNSATKDKFLIYSTDQLNLNIGPWGKFQWNWKEMSSNNLHICGNGSDTFLKHKQKLISTNTTSFSSLPLMKLPYRNKVPWNKGIAINLKLDFCQTTHNKAHHHSFLGYPSLFYGYLCFWQRSGCF